MARFTGRLWLLEQYASPFHPLEECGSLGKLLEQLIDAPDYEWLMIDARYIEVHPHAAGAKGGNPDMGRTKGGSTRSYIWPWMRPGMPVRIVITPGTSADCTSASKRIEGFTAEHLLADRGYDSNALLEQAAQQGMHPVIPPKKHRLIPREYDKYLYILRHLVENAFLHLKR